MKENYRVTSLPVVRGIGDVPNRVFETHIVGKIDSRIFYHFAGLSNSIDESARQVLDYANSDDRLSTNLDNTYSLLFEGYRSRMCIVDSVLKDFGCNTTIMDFGDPFVKAHICTY